MYKTIAVTFVINGMKVMYFFTTIAFYHAQTSFVEVFTTLCSFDAPVILI